MASPKIEFEVHVPEVKPGYRSTEFYLTLAALVIGSLLMCGVLGEGKASEIAGSALAVLSVLGYTFSRGKAKAMALMLMQQALATPVALAPPPSGAAGGE